MNKPKLGYVGMGIMGLPMTLNLLRSGYDVAVWNRTTSKSKPAIDAGANVCASPADVAAMSDVVFINVTDTKDVESVLFGADSVSTSARPGLIVVDHSTISPDATRSFAKRLKESGVAFLDAPVTGGDVGAKAGTLSIMVGGDTDAYAIVKPVLERVGKTITHVGDVGMGQLCKLCNQIAVFANLAGACEAIELARAGGLDPQVMLNVVGAGAGASWQLTNLGPKAIAQDFKPGFTLDLAIKDMGLVKEAFEKAGLDLRVITMAAKYMKQVQANGGGPLATPAIIQGIKPRA
jgi:3-hydroxyisobutyrate dehydrogenase